jgi:hypothetical protein
MSAQIRALARRMLLAVAALAVLATVGCRSGAPWLSFR